VQVSWPRDLNFELWVYLNYPQLITQSSQWLEEVLWRTGYKLIMNAVIMWLT
jgi:hypothetical protein